MNPSRHAAIDPPSPLLKYQTPQHTIAVRKIMLDTTSSPGRFDVGSLRTVAQSPPKKRAPRTMPTTIIVPYGINESSINAPYFRLATTAMHSSSRQTIPAATTSMSTTDDFRIVHQSTVHSPTATPSNVGIVTEHRVHNAAAHGNNGSVMRRVNG